MTGAEGHTEPRRPYQKPRVEQVQLVAEEQVLGLCKTETDGGGIGMGAGQSCFFDNNCKEDGT